MVGEQVFAFMGAGLGLHVLRDEDYPEAVRILRKSSLNLE